MADRSLRLGDLRDAAKEELQSTLAKVVVGGDRKKGVIMDRGVHRMLTLSGITDEVLTPANGVEFVDMLGDTCDVNAAPVRSICIFARPTLDLMRNVANVITSYHNKNKSLKFYVFFVPKKTLICAHVLGTEYGFTRKLEGQLEMEEFELDFVLLDEDLMSMEMPSVFRDVFLEGDTTSLHYITRALIKLQTAVVGPIPRVCAKGAVAAKVLNFLRRMSADVGSEFMNEQASHVEALYIIDRGVDLMTPMLTQLTYEGLVDESYNIECGSFKPTFEVPNMKSEDNGRVKLATVQTTDEIFEDIRDMNFTQVAGALHQKSLSVKNAYEKRKEMQQLREIRDFMKLLPQMQEQHRLVGIHTAIATQLTKLSQAPPFRRRVAVEHSVVHQTEEKEFLEYVEELINNGAGMTSVLRLICLYSVANNGIKAKVYDALRESFMLSYGIPETIAAWYNLERVGLLTKNTGGILQQANALASTIGHMSANKDSRPPFAALRKACRLWVEDLNEKTPNDIAYAYSGYAPLLLRVVEALNHLNVTGAVERAQSSASLHGSNSGWSNTNLPPIDVAPGDFDTMAADAEVAGSTRTVMIFVVGGITHAEVNAVRLMLSSLSDDSSATVRRRYVVATTSLTNGTKMIESVLPFAPPS